MAKSKTELSNAGSKSSGLAIAGLVLAIIGLVLSVAPIINNFETVLAIPILGLVFGIIAAVKSKANKATATAAIILSIIALIIVIATRAFNANAIDQAGKPITKSLNDSTGKNTNKILESDVDVKIGKFAASKDQYDVWTTELPVTLTNKLSQKASYSVEIEAVDSSNKRIATDTLTSDDLSAKQSQDFKAFQFVDSAKAPKLEKASFKVFSASKY